MEAGHERAGRVFVGLGSNVADRRGHLQYAVNSFRDHAAIRVRAASPVYESEAHTVGGSGRPPPFLNAVVELETRLTPTELLAFCLAVERGAGRDRSGSERWAPRTLDIDLLIFGQVRMQDKRLTLPHPRLQSRMFVLRPLADIAPDVHVPPPIDARVRDLLETCRDESWIRRTAIRLLDERDDTNDA